MLLLLLVEGREEEEEEPAAAATGVVDIEILGELPRWLTAPPGLTPPTHAREKACACITCTNLRQEEALEGRREGERETERKNQTLSDRRRRARKWKKQNSTEEKTEQKKLFTSLLFHSVRRMM